MQTFNDIKSFALVALMLMMVAGQAVAAATPNACCDTMSLSNNGCDKAELFIGGSPKAPDTGERADGNQRPCDAFCCTVVGSITAVFASKKNASLTAPSIDTLWFQGEAALSFRQSLSTPPPRK